MEIANAQHYKAEPPTGRRYGIEPGESDDETSSDDEEVQLYSEIVDEEVCECILPKILLVMSQAY